MKDIKRASKLVGYCGAYCGECGMYRGRICAKITKDFLEAIKAGDYADWVPKYVKPDFNFNDFLKDIYDCWLRLLNFKNS